MKISSSEAVETKHSLEPTKEINKDELLIKLFSGKNKLLSDEGETLSVSRDTKNLLAYFSDGAFVVSQSNRYDGRVLSFEALVKQRGLKIEKPIYTSLGILNSIYKENAKRKDSNAPLSDDFNNQIQKDYVDIIANASEKGVSDVHVVV